MKARNISICNRRTKWARPQHPQPFTLTRAQEVRPVPPFSMHPFPAQNPLQYALAGRQSCTRLLTTCDFSLSCSLLAFTFRSVQHSNQHLPDTVSLLGSPRTRLLSLRSMNYQEQSYLTRQHTSGASHRSSSRGFQTRYRQPLITLKHRSSDDDLSEKHQRKWQGNTKANSRGALSPTARPLWRQETLL